MGPSPGNWLATHRAYLTLSKTAMSIFVAKFYGRMPFLSPTQTLSATYVVGTQKNHFMSKKLLNSPAEFGRILGGPGT